MKNNLISVPRHTSEQEPIAIIGMACIFPGAANLSSYWDNIQKGVDAISEVPPARLASVFFDPDSTAPNRFYCRRGGFVDDYVDFDPLAYGVMPKAAQGADPDQLLSLRVGTEALRDAGLLDTDFNRQKTGVILGRGNYLSAGTLRLEQHVRLVQQTLQNLKELIPDITPGQLEQVHRQISAQLTDYGPDTAVGLVPNLVASRLANRLDLKGPAYTVDAACASTLLAVEQSCQSLRRGETDLMVAGGLHFTHDLTFWSIFCQLGAFSRTDSIRPMSANADGILAGEGIGIVVLKRLRDAVADGNRIYAVIKGVACASDGRGSSLMAPSVSGQLLALQRSWEQTAIDKNALGLIEAHGTGTPAGDVAELETLQRFFGAASAGESPRAGLGSVKSMIGHTMAAAGAAGLIKAALSVYQGVLPMSLHAQQPNPLLEKTRFRLLAKTEPWQCKREQRIAAVNAFGFGGINAHLILSGHSSTSDSVTDAVVPIANGGKRPAVDELRVINKCNVLRLSANSQAALLEKLARRDLTTNSNDTWRVAILSPTEKRLELAKTIIEKGVTWPGRQQIYFSAKRLLKTGKLAFLFPGVDSTFDPQVEDVARHFGLVLPEHCEKLNPFDDLMNVGIGLIGLNGLLHQVLSKMGIYPDAMAGHSVGEWSAMAACGYLRLDLLIQICGCLHPDFLQLPNVRFLAVACGKDKLKGLYEDIDNLYISHENCHHQVIFCSTEASIKQFSGRLRENNIIAQVLPIISGFHSPLVAESARPFIDFFDKVPMQAPRTTLWSANSARPFPVAMAKVRGLVREHIVDTVRFRELIDNMYKEGFRAFIQVGFGSLTGFVGDTLREKPHVCVAANTNKRSGLEQLTHLAAALWVEGYEPDFHALGITTGMADRGIAQSAITSVANTANGKMKLQLGVPLIKLTPVDGLSASTSASLNSSAFAPKKAHENATAQAPLHPFDQLFQQTLEDVRLAGEEVERVWHSYRQTGTAEVASQHHSVAQKPKSAEFVPVKKILKRRLDIYQDLGYVMDHCFYREKEDWPVVEDRNPVIPLTMELNLMRDAVQQVIPHKKVISLEKVHAFNWLRVSKPTDIDIEVNHLRSGSAEVCIQGYAKALAILDDDYPATLEARAVEYENPRPAPVEAAQLYSERWMFHGPAYQAVTKLGPIADNGIQGRLKVPQGNGALLDNMGQLAGYWVMEQKNNCLAMPVGIEKVTFCCPDPALGQEFLCHVVVRELASDRCISDMELVDDQGRVAVKIDGWTTRRFPMNQHIWLRSRRVEKSTLSQVSERGYVVFHDVYDAAITRDYFAKRYLNQPELDEYDKVPPRHRRQWLNGRIAAKDAIRSYYWQRHGRFDFYPKEIRICNDHSGRPVAFGHVSDTYDGSLYIFITHTDNLTIAMAHDEPVQIDIGADLSFNDAVMHTGEISLAFNPANENEHADEVVSYV